MRNINAPFDTTFSTLGNSNLGSSQDSIAPNDSASLFQSPDQLRLNDSIIESYVKGCWARPAFTKETSLINGKSVCKWKCLLCERQYGYNEKTTTNIRTHLKSHHQELANA